MSKIIYLGDKNGKTAIEYSKMKEAIAEKMFDEEMEIIHGAYEDFKDKVDGLVLGPSVVNATSEMAELCNNLQLLMGSINSYHHASEVMKKKQEIIDAYNKRFKKEIREKNIPLGVRCRKDD